MGGSPEHQLRPVMTTLCDCPESNRAQWSFRLFGVPVQVKYWFWISIVLLGATEDPGALLIWVAVCFASILLHELGHVYAFRLFGQDTRVVLYAWGGMAISRSSYETPLARFVVALAGPIAGFCLTALTVAVAYLSGARVHIGFHIFLPVLTAWPDFADVPGDGMPRFYLWHVLLNDLLWVNFYWGLVNLLPVYPLDGGHAAGAVFEQRDRYNGRRKALILSASVAAAVALFGIVERSLYMVLMFAVLAASSLQSLDSLRTRTKPLGNR
jgi:stage IV sporulation protein FB